MADQPEHKGSASDDEPELDLQLQMACGQDVGGKRNGVNGTHRRT